MKKFRTILNCIFAFTLIFMLIAIIGMNENSNYVKDNYSEDLSDGWMLSQPDGTRSEMTLPMIIRMEIPISGSSSLCPT